MRKIHQLFAGLLLTVLITSCSLEKRVYMPGYHLEWNKKSQSFQKNETSDKNTFLEKVPYGNASEILTENDLLSTNNCQEISNNFLTASINESEYYLPNNKNQILDSQKQVNQNNEKNIVLNSNFDSLNSEKLFSKYLTNPFFDADYSLGYQVKDTLVLSEEEEKLKIIQIEKIKKGAKISMFIFWIPLFGFLHCLKWYSKVKRFERKYKINLRKEKTTLAWSLGVSVLFSLPIFAFALLMIFVMISIIAQGGVS